MKTGKKRGVERTQIATRNEEWSDERLKLFLEIEPPSGIPADYNVLLKAYRGMTKDLFKRFLELYIEAGRDVNCRHNDGSTLLDLVSKHRKSEDYTIILKAVGAFPSEV